MQTTRSRSRTLLLGLLLLLTTAAVGYMRYHRLTRRGSGGLAASKPNGYNVIMISMNNIAAEHMSLYGYKRSTTPGLAALAQHALVFDEVYTPASWTLPSATSVMTGLAPYSHRVVSRKEANLLSPAIPTLGEIFKQAGYATATFTGGLDYRPSFGHLRGCTDTSLNTDFTPFSTTCAQASRWLAYQNSKPFFLVIQGYDAHPPFHPPAPFKGTFSGGQRTIHVSTEYAVRGFKEGNKYIASYIGDDPHLDAHGNLIKPLSDAARTVELTQDDIDYLRDLYDDTVKSVDSAVSGFVQSLAPQVRDRTIIVIFSEHGEMFGKNGRFGRAGLNRGTLYDEVAHVPLILCLPSQLSGRVQGLVQLVDLHPTVLQLVGLQPSPLSQGQSLLPLLDDHPVNRYAYAGCEYNVGHEGRANSSFQDASINESVRSQRYKLLHEIVYHSNPQGNLPPAEETFELYDVSHDKDEAHNLLGELPTVAEELKQALASWAATTKAACQDKQPSHIDFPPDFEMRARTHGYW
jgi:arylsulfatase A-like enzyme